MFVNKSSSQNRWQVHFIQDNDVFGADWHRTFVEINKKAASSLNAGFSIRMGNKQHCQDIPACGPTVR